MVRCIIDRRQNSQISPLTTTMDAGRALVFGTKGFGFESRREYMRTFCTFGVQKLVIRHHTIPFSPFNIVVSGRILAYQETFWKLT